MNKSAFAISATALLLPGIAVGADRYVRQGAGGLANGTDWNHAYTALPATLVRGDTYWIGSGDYAGYTFDDAGATTITVKKATVSAHGTDTGWDNSFATGNGGAAKFNGSLYFTAGNYTIDGVTGGGPGSWNSGHGIHVINAGGNVINSASSAAQNITLRHLDIRGGTPQGQANVMINDYDGNHNWHVSHCYLHDSGHNGMYVAGDNFLFEYSYLTRYNGVSGHLVAAWILKGASTTNNADQFLVHNATFRYSLLGWVNGTGGFSTKGTGHRFYGNCFFKDPGSGNNSNGMITGWGDQAQFNIHCYNNTFIGDWFNGQGGSAINFPGVTTGNIARNNLFSTCIVGFSGVGTRGWNAYWNLRGAAPDNDPNPQTFGSDPIGDTPNYDFGLNFETDPGLTLQNEVAANGLVHTYDRDMFGNIRGADGVWTRGAIEFGAGDPVPPAITSSTNANAVNLAAFSYGIAATGATSFGATNLPTGLSVNGSSGLISGTPNVSPGTFVVGLLATNSVGHAHTNLFLEVTTAAAVIGVTPTITDYGEMLEDTTADIVFTITNSGDASTILTGHVTNEPAPWSVVGNRDYNLAGGTSTNITLRFAPTTLGVYSNTFRATGGGNATNTVFGRVYPLLTSPFSATHGLFTAPFQTNDNYLHQEINAQNDIHIGGRAVFGFTLAADAMVKLRCLILATNTTEDSVWINIDDDPLPDTPHVWDVILTTGFEERLAGWRGGGDPWTGPGVPEFPTNSWNLTAGTHKLVIRGREPHTQIQTITIVTDADPQGELPNMAADPAPQDGQTNVDPVLVLSWAAGLNTLGYELYFGTDATPDATEFIEQTGSTSHNIGTQDYLTTYYWRVDATNAVGRTTGTIWSFTTRPPIPVPGQVRAVKQARNPSLLFLP